MFVITGVLESLEREEIGDIIKKYGGKVTTSISGRTSYVIVGEEAGESKLAKVTQLEKIGWRLRLGIVYNNIMINTQNHSTFSSCLVHVMLKLMDC